MLNEKDKKKIIKFSKKYSVKKVLLFGSSLDNERESNDIDIAIEGIADRDYFKYYGDLIFSLSKPVDLIDLSSDTKFNSLVKQEGMLLYGRL